MKAFLCAIMITWCLVAFSFGARAQTRSPESKTITVTATATASGPVSGANVMAVVAGNGMDTAGLEQTLTKVGVSGFINDQSLLSKLPSAVGVRGRLHAATHDDLVSVEDAVKAYVKAHGSGVVVQLRFFGLVTDCRAIVAKARTAALEQARGQAQQLAIAAGVGGGIGDVVSVAEAKGCPPAGPLGGAYTIDPQTLAMTVPVQETVTYSTAPK